LATSPLSDEEVVLHHHFYDEDCLAAACKAYEKFADVSVQQGTLSSAVSVVPKPGASDLMTVRREFLNYVLDLSIKKRLAS
jgi:hypothetical protein